MTQGKVVVVGLDGLAPRLVEPWMQEGKLPNLARMAQEGAYGRLLSTMPPVSPQAWSSFLTGKNPGKHGIFGFAHRKPGGYSWTVTTARDRLGPDLGQIITARGKSVGLFAVPLTYPPSGVNGYMISGMGTPGPEAQFAYPVELKSKLLSAFTADQVFTESPALYADPETCFDALERSIADQGKVFQWLQEQFTDLSCEVVVFVQSDRAQHFGWHYLDPESPLYSAALSARSPRLRDAILRIYQRLDTAVGQIAERLNPSDTLIVMSDHGAGPYDKFVDLNAWLLREGYLHLKDSSTWSSGSLFASLYSTWRAWGRELLPLSFRERVKRRLPSRIHRQVESEKQNPTASRIDWSRTRAFSEGTEGLITLNVVGREPSGVVSPGAEREDLIQEIAGRLLSLRDPDSGHPVVSRVWRREELYEGAALDRAPDLIVEWYADRYHSRTTSNLQGKIFWKPDQWWQSGSMVLSGHHLREGILFSKGPFVEPGTAVQGARIIDIAPTILALMGLPLLPDLDGEMLSELTVGIADHPVQQVEFEIPGDEPVAYTDEEASQIEDLLRGLGYVE